MSTSHTPGPWKANLWAAGWSISAPNSHYTVCRLDECNNSTANARLIEAAPEMLEALKVLYARLSAHTAQIESCDLDPRTEQAFKSARAAIAKAGVRCEH